MTEPSVYERDAWNDLRRRHGRPLSRAIRGAGSGIAKGARKVGEKASEFLEDHPDAKKVVESGQKRAADAGKAIQKGAKLAIDALPEDFTTWTGEALVSAQKTISKLSRAGLSPAGVVKKHQKKGHDVRVLPDVRRLDLEQVDAIRGRGLAWYYPAIAALSGAGAGLVISGGELVLTVTGGVAAAPSAGAVVAAFSADAAAVLGLSSRAVGHVALLYGYDPEQPGEKLFVMSVVNAGTAVSATAKSAALSDISRLTQALVRQKTWTELQKSVVAKVAKQFSGQFGVRLTKQGLGKIVPAIGIVVGGAFNWATVEDIVDTADAAYRERFLLEKYPHLAGDSGVVITASPVTNLSSPADEIPDEDISIVDELAEAGGPDLR